MSRWITFYKDIMAGGIRDFEIHKDKATATAYFKDHYRDYFTNAKPLKNIELPAWYGFPFRYFAVMSLPGFKKAIAKEKGMSIDEVTKAINKYIFDKREMRNES